MSPTLLILLASGGLAVGARFSGSVAQLAGEFPSSSGSKAVMSVADPSLHCVVKGENTTWR